jgi:hypothetical protein
MSIESKVPRPLFVFVRPDVSISHGPLRPKSRSSAPARGIPVSRAVAILCGRQSAHRSNALVLEFTDAPKHPVSIELPEGFDIEASDHIAWLFFNIERALAKPAT